MFRHIGETRTFRHNLSIASLLSFVAGIVNVVGFLAVQKITTNVTGHFAFLIDEVFNLNFLKGITFFLYVFFFLLGSFISSLIVQLVSRKNKKYIYLVPVLLESLILFSIPNFSKILYHFPDVLAFTLLFAMGLQNSLVTNISKSVVRTTHLTGLFTDLGIEFSQLFFIKEKFIKKNIISSIRLRLTIILSFFVGGIISGFMFPKFQLHVLSFAASILVLGATFDYLKYGVLQIKRKYVNKNH